MNLLDKITELSREIIYIYRDEHVKHISFLARRNKILSVGINDKTCTHPMSTTQFQRLHSEVDAISRIKDKKILSRLKLINVRINKHYEFRLSKPCPSCELLCQVVGIKQVIFTESSDKFPVWNILKL